MVTFGSKPEFAKDMIVVKDQDPAVAESESFMMYQGLRNNRFLLATYLDILIATDRKEEAVSTITKLIEMDQIRYKYWGWRYRQLTK